jgi:hypothetical protein
MITLVGMSYINNININILIGILFYLESIIKNDISITKNVSFITSIIFSGINTYNIYPQLFYPFIIAVLVGVISRHIRNIIYNYKGHNVYMFLFTYLWHICITVILFISSYTAND